MASAKKLPSGSWRIQVYSHTEIIEGKKKKVMHSITAPTKEEAEYQAAAFKRQHGKRTSTDITLGDAMTGYIQSRDGILSPSTINGYRSLQRNYMVELQKKSIYKIANVDIQFALNQEKKDHNLSAKTIKNISGFVSASIGFYREDFRINVKLPAREKQDYYLPTIDDLGLLLAYTDGKELGLAILLAAFLGLRRGEICTLKWTDFDWKRKEVKINKAMVQNDKKEWVVKNPKTYSGSRVISLSDGLIQELQKYKKKSGPLFSEDTIPNHITHRFGWAVRHLGLNHFRFHDLRHFSASLMMAEGVPDKYAIERMGHSTTAILQTVYQHTENKKRTEINATLNGKIDTVLVHTRENTPHEFTRNRGYK